jgi:hypothetical protein
VIAAVGLVGVVGDVGLVVGALVTVSARVVVFVRLPLVARMVMVLVPTVAALLVDKVRVPAVDPLPILRLFTLTPVGSPVTVIPTAVFNPFKRVTEMVADSARPC